jgi:hypothetical protein
MKLRRRKGEGARAQAKDGPRYQLVEEKARVAVVAALVPFRGASRTLSRAMGGGRESRTGAEVRASNGWEWVAGGPAKGLRRGGGGEAGEGLGNEAGDGGRKGGNAARQQERGEREEG